MTVELRLEKLSEAMETATVVRWLKRVGEPVNRGEVIAELETEKAGVELEAPGSGVISQILVPEGTEQVPVGELLAVIEATAADKPKATGPIAAGPSGPPQAADLTTAAPAVPNPRLVSIAFSGEKRGADSAPESEPVGASSSSPVALSGAQAQSVAATPLAKAMAAIAGVDLAKLPQDSGGVNRRRVEQALLLNPSPMAAAAARPPAISKPPDEMEPVGHSLARKTTAARLTEAKQTIPHFYLSTDCEISSAIDTISVLARQASGPRLTLTAFLIKATASAASHYPVVNSVWTPAHLIMRDQVNIAVGVATESGLTAPVVRNANERTLTEIAQTLEDLVARARSGKLRPADFDAATITVSNLGMYGVGTLFPIITPGQSCVLGFGAAREVALVREGAVTAGKLMTITLSGDHRAFDGAQGAEFLRELKATIEEPMRMLL